MRFYVLCLCFSLFVFKSEFVFANGILNRALYQYLLRDFDENGIDQASASWKNFNKFLTKNMNTEGEFARVRQLQAVHFLSQTSSINKAYYLQDGIGLGTKGVLYFEKQFGKNPFSNTRITNREKKIYADLLFWKAMVFIEWIKSQGGGFQNELNKIKSDMQMVVNNGYGCMNGGGPYNLLGQVLQAYQCTRKTFKGSDDFNWHGWNILSYSQYLRKNGQSNQATLLLEKFLKYSVEELAADFIPENRVAQKKAKELLLSWNPNGFSKYSLQTGRVQKIKQYVQGEFLVLLKNPSRLKIQDANFSHALKNAGLAQKISENIFLFSRPKVENMDYSVGAIQKILPDAIVEPNYWIHINNQPNDFEYSKQWNFLNIGQLDSKGQKGLAQIDINIEPAWKIYTGNSEVVVGVIDTGIDFSHPDLAVNAWVNELEAHGKSSFDDDGNGYVDDINGYDFINNKSIIVDDHGHGTHVAGIIGARGNDQLGIAGINWNVKLMSLKFLDSNGGGDMASAIKAIKYAIQKNVKITNNSWGTGDNSQILKAVIEEAKNAGMLFVAAAGNSGENADVSPEFPSGFDLENIVSVASINNRGLLSDFSNYGVNSVDIAAPGENIYSTLPGQKFASWSGTSMATPHVAGVAALIWGQDPKLSAHEVKDIILNSARPLTDLKARVKSNGMLDAFSALTRQNNSSDPYDPTLWQTQAMNINSPNPYLDNTRDEFYIKKENSKFITAKFKKFKLEEGYDKVLFFDGKNHLVGFWTGNHDLEFAPIVEGDSLTIHLITDSHETDSGFEINEMYYQ